ncbi:MAG: hypothetical protein AB1742_15800 [bacterium]
MKGNGGVARTIECSVCGGEFTFSPQNRCESCLRFCCRDCLKVSYYESGRADRTGTPTRTLCYECYHAADTRRAGSDDSP